FVTTRSGTHVGDSRTGVMRHVLVARQPASARRRALAVVVAALTGGCAAHTRPTVPDQFVTLNSHALRLHFENGGAAAPRPLLVYAWGGGGMHREGPDSLRHLATLCGRVVRIDG